MSVEAETAGAQDSTKQVNGDGAGDRPNGVTNGHTDSSGVDGGGIGSSSEDRHKSHKSSSKDKHRDKDRDRDRDRDKDKSRDKDRDREKDKHRDKDRDRDKHKSSSSSSKDKDRDKEKSSSSSKDKDREKDRDRHSSSHKSSKSDKDRDRDKDKERSKDKDRSKDKERDKYKDSEKDKERSKDKDRDKDRDREKDKDRKDRDKEKSSSSSKDKDRDRDKHKSSSSSSRDKEKDRNKEKERDKEKDREKDKHKSSSSSKDKDKHSSSSKDKDRKDRDRSKSSSSKDKENEKKDKIKEESDVKPPTIIEYKKEEAELDDFSKQEPAAMSNGIEDQESNESSQDVKEVKMEDPLNISQSSCDYSLSQFRQDETPFKVKTEHSDFNSTAEDMEEDDQFEAVEADAAVKEEPEDAPVKREAESDSDDEVPLSKRKKKEDDEGFGTETKKKKGKAEKKDKKNKKKKRGYDSEAEQEEEEEEYDAPKKKAKKAKVKNVPVKKQQTKTKVKTEVEESPTKGRKKKPEEEQEVWKWWEEEKREDGVKWNTLEHKGPVFAPPYEPLPPTVKFKYDGKEMKLSEDAEEVAGFYARMLEHEYTSKQQFNDNFFKDWRKSMTAQERETIKDLKKCFFGSMHAHFAELSERNRNRTKEEKLALKQKNEELLKEYGTCTIDGHKEKIGNFKIEPPGLFRGRGEHPKMGMVKRRVMPEDVIINCGKESKFPEAPEGHRWKEVRHDNTVSWLASWTENVQGQVKYVMLNPSSKLKGEKDWQKYETARRLLKHIDKIRDTYRDEWKSKEMRIRQRAVAMYFIDKLALRAGNEKDEDQADTVGCCSLRVEHIELHKELNGKENVVVFDFLGKDSIRYYNEVEVEKRVFKNLELFKENKKDGDDLFDRLNTSVLNEHLRELMEGLTAKVFRTFNASFTLQNQLAELTDPEMTVPEKLLAYNRANRAVAILCNHQRAVPKSHDKSMSNLKEKIRLKREAVDQCQKEFKELKKRGDAAAKEKKHKMLERLKDQLKKLELQETDRDENKTIALGTSKLNYLDPRISVAWCKKFGVPIEKIFNKTHRDKFRWAIDMADENYVF